MDLEKKGVLGDYQQLRKEFVRVVNDGKEHGVEVIRMVEKSAR